MADTLETTVGRLEASQQQNRRFVADVSHELRTPLTALVAEASLIEQRPRRHVPDGRRAAQLLVADVRRLRDLVDELMEVSRFDADAETVEPAAGRPRSARDRGGHDPAPVGRRSALPPRARRSWRRTRDGSTGSSATSSTTRGTTRPDGPVEVSLSRTLDGATIVVADRGPGRAGGGAAAGSSTASTRPTRRGPAGARASASRSPPSTRRCSARRSVRGQRPGGGLIFALTLPVTEPLPAGDAARHVRRRCFRGIGAHIRGPAHDRPAQAVARSIAVACVAVLVAACAPRRARSARRRRRRRRARRRSRSRPTTRRPTCRRRRASGSPTASPHHRPRRPSPPSSAPVGTPSPRPRSRRHHDRPRLLLPRQLHRQRRPRAGPARGAEDPGRGHGGGPRPARRPEREGARAPARRCTPTCRRGRGCSACRSRTASRRSTCRPSSSRAATSRRSSGGSPRSSTR